MASKSAQPDAVDVEELLDYVDKTMERLKTLYEQYFLGMQKQAPSHLHNDIERRIRDLMQIQIRNTGLRYRFATLQQKFGSYNSYWRRTLRQIEQGTYIRQLARITRKAAQTGEEIPEEILSAMPKRMQEQVKRDREQARAIAARRAAAMGGADVDLHDDPNDDEAPAVIGESPQVKNAVRKNQHVLSDSDGDLDIDAFFASVSDDTNPDGKAFPDDDRDEATGSSPPPAPTPMAARAQALPPRSGPAPALPQRASTPAMAPRQTPPPPLAQTQSLPRVGPPPPPAPGQRFVAPERAGTVPGVNAPAVPPQRQTQPIPVIPSTRATGPIPTQPAPPSPPNRASQPIPVVPPNRATGPVPVIPPNRATGPVPVIPPNRATGPVPVVPAPARPGTAPSQVTRPNPVAPGSSQQRPAVPVESMQGPFPRTPPVPAPRTEPPRPAPAPAPAPMRPPPGMNDADVNALYATYVKAKQAVGEEAGPGAYSKLLKTINTQAPKIMEQYKAKGVEFSVVVKDNQVIIKAKPKP